MAGGAEGFPQAGSYSENELASLRQAFAAFDKDGSGTIDASELKQCLKAMGKHPDPLELEELLRQMDTDGNGVIDFEEFAAALGDQNGVSGAQSRPFKDG